LSPSTELARTALEEAGAVVDETSLHFADPAAVEWDQLVRVCGFLGSLGRGYPWWVGDVLNMAEDIHPEIWAQLEVYFPHSPSTLANYKSVAKHVPSHRRLGLHMTVVSEAAYLPPDQRDALLHRAAAEGWKREEMREARREMQGQPIGELPPAKPATKCPNCGHTWET